MPAEISIRPGTSADHDFVTDSFWRTYAESPYADGLTPQTLNGLLAPFLASWQLTVACASHAHDEIIAFVLWSNPRAVAWVHTKRGYRRRGAARALLDFIGCKGGEVSTPFLVTRILRPDSDIRDDFLRLTKDKGYTLRFRPYLGLALPTERAA